MTSAFWAPNFGVCINLSLFPVQPVSGIVALKAVGFYRDTAVFIAGKQQLRTASHLKQHHLIQTAGNRLQFVFAVPSIINPN